VSRRSGVAGFAAVVVLLTCGVSSGQESRIASDFRRLGEHLKEECGAFRIVACANELATGFPMHVTFGSLAPQNGFAFGLAFVEHWTPSETWRISWNADAVAAPSGSWRAGAYAKFIYTGVEPPVAVTRGGTGAKPGVPAVREYPVLSVYAQTTSLRELSYFGPASYGVDGRQSAFSERQTIVGTRFVYPLARVPLLGSLRPSLVGAVNGRFLQVRGRAAGSVPAIDEAYDELTAPGLSSQPAFVQFDEGFRIMPVFGGGRLRLNYLVGAQQFVAGASDHASFRRWTLDLRHEIPIYRNVFYAGPRETNGPNECAIAVGSTTCPAISTSRNRQGAIGLRLLVTTSGTSGGNRVPFYFQPTLGGADINGQRLLSSAADYRYRGPNLLALQETFEHSLWGPFGVMLEADQGKVADRRQALGFSDLLHSYSVGLTIRAGGLPYIVLSYSWGTGGHHVIGAMDASLLGGSGRPSMF
jgi:hypothetical protein